MSNFIDTFPDRPDWITIHENKAILENETGLAYTIHYRDYPYLKIFVTKNYSAIEIEDSLHDFFKLLQIKDEDFVTIVTKQPKLFSKILRDSADAIDDLLKKINKKE